MEGSNRHMESNAHGIDGLRKGSIPQCPVEGLGFGV